MQQHLYKEHRIEDILDAYIKELSQNKGDVKSQALRNKWRSYRNRMLDRSYLKELRVLFNETFELLRKKYQDIHFSVEGRRKSLISMEKKIQRYLESGKSLDLIRDFYAFRIILWGKSEEELIPCCYDVIQEIIEYSVTKGFNPTYGLPLIDSNHQNQNPFYEQFPYRENIKDYICFPKENGYQSIHLVLVDPKERHLEVQVRTFEMHLHAEAGDADHAEYKDKKYTNLFSFDREKINVEGYRFFNGHVFDLAGVEKSVTIFERQT